MAGAEAKVRPVDHPVALVVAEVRSQHVGGRFDQGQRAPRSQVSSRPRRGRAGRSGVGCGPASPGRADRAGPDSRSRRTPPALEASRTTTPPQPRQAGCDLRCSSNSAHLPVSGAVRQSHLKRCEARSPDVEVKVGCSFKADVCPEGVQNSGSATIRKSQLRAGPVQHLEAVLHRAHVRPDAPRRGRVRALGTIR
jgi:hypothetical protein